MADQNTMAFKDILRLLPKDMVLFPLGMSAGAMLKDEKYKDIAPNCTVQNDRYGFVIFNQGDYFYGFPEKVTIESRKRLVYRHPGVTTDWTRRDGREGIWPQLGGVDMLPILGDATMKQNEAIGAVGTASARANYKVNLNNQESRQRMEEGILNLGSDIRHKILQVLPDKEIRVTDDLSVRIVEIHIGCYTWIYKNSAGALLGGKFGSMDELTNDLQRKTSSRR